MINKSLHKGINRVAAAATLAILAGCNLSTGDATTSNINSFISVRNPVGHVQGIVLDSNSRPIANATVAVGGRSTTTSASGTYEFRDLEVTNTVVSDQQDGNGGNAISTSNHPAFKLVITPPAPTTGTTPAYLGAIVTVYPEAQFNNVSGGNQSGSGNASAGSQTVFVDGFRIQAADAVLPELSTTVEVLALRDANSGGLLPTGTSVTLDFVNVAATSGSDENTNTSAVQYPTVVWAGTVSSTGNVTFTSVAANSTFNMHIAGYKCQTSAGSTATSGSNATSNTCSIASANETNKVTYSNYYGVVLADAGDTVSPFITRVASVYDSTQEPLLNGATTTQCEDGAAANSNKIGKLLRNVNGTAANGGFVLVANEALQSTGVTSASAVVYDATNGAYVTVSGVAISGGTVTVTTASALTPGTEFSLYLYTPEFLDAAGNALTSVGTTLSFDCNGQINPQSGSGTSFVAFDLEVYNTANTNTGSVASIQENLDPRLSGTNNDFPVNQAKSITFNDVRDNDGFIWGMNATESPNSTGDIESAIALRGNAYGTISGVGESFTAGVNLNEDVGRVEFTPIANASGYIVSVNGDSVNLTDGDFSSSAGITNTSAGVLDGSTVYSGFVVRGAATKYVLVITDAHVGDVVSIAATDDLGHAGTISTVSLVDNVVPTVTVQRSYQNNLAFSNFASQSIQNDSAGDNASGCFTQNNDHAGVALASGTRFFGEGGELSDPGTAQTSTNLCIGVSPYLLVNSDQDSTTAHTELEAGRAAAFDAVAANVSAYPRAYDAAAFTAWVRPTIKMGAAVTENLGSVGTPTDTVSATLSGFAVQNDTVDTHLGGAPVVKDLITFDVNDAYVLANTDNGGTISFVGMTDLAGNAATAAANPVLTVRDEWPAYIVSGQRESNGTITLVFNEAVRIDNGNSVQLRDGSGSFTFTFAKTGGSPTNYTLSADKKTVTILTADTVTGIGPAESAAYRGLFTDTDSLFYSSTQHVIVDFDSIRDVRGNSWAAHTYFAAQPNGDTPEFVLSDALPSFAVTMSETSNNTALAFNVTLSGNHAARNWFQTLASSTPADPANDGLFQGETGTNCTEAADGSVSCTAAFASTILTVTSGTCTVPVFGAATLNAAHTLMTFPITCNVATTAGDTISVQFGNAAPTAPVTYGGFQSEYDGSVTKPAGTGVDSTVAGVSTITLN